MVTDDRDPALVKYHQALIASKHFRRHLSELANQLLVVALGRPEPELGHNLDRSDAVGILLRVVRDLLEDLDSLAKRVPFATLVH